MRHIKLTIDPWTVANVTDCHLDNLHDDYFLDC